MVGVQGQTVPAALLGERNFLVNQKSTERLGFMARIKTEHITLRLTPLEKEKLSAKAAEARMNMSQYLLALSEQKKIIVADELPELCRQIIRIGTNVNQITAVANTHKSVSEKQLDIVNLNLIEIQNLLGKLIDTIKNSDDEIKV